MFSDQNMPPLRENFSITNQQPEKRQVLDKANMPMKP
jgi:hypothetical protein